MRTQTKLLVASIAGVVTMLACVSSIVLLRSFGVIFVDRESHDPGPTEFVSENGLLRAPLHACDSDDARALGRRALPFPEPLASAPEAPSAVRISDLSRCASRSSGYDAVDAELCLRTLASIDRPAARRIAEHAAVGTPFPPFDRLVVSLRRYETIADVEAVLVGVGMIPAGSDARQPPRGAVDGFDVLRARGRAYDVDAEALEVPVPHDRLAATLARLTPDALGRVSFAQRAPVDRQRPGYRLVASFDGRCVAVSVADHGDWYDYESVLGFLNALLASSGRAERFVTVARSLDSAVSIVVAEPAAFARAARASLVLDP